MNKCWRKDKRPPPTSERQDMPRWPSCDRFFSVTVAGLWGKVHGKITATGDPGDPQNPEEQKARMER